MSLLPVMVPTHESILSPSGNAETPGSPHIISAISSDCNLQKKKKTTFLDFFVFCFYGNGKTGRTNLGTYLFTTDWASTVLRPGAVCFDGSFWRTAVRAVVVL